ncbi:MAG: hypothetical protein KDD33_11450 [Bdellovibrionales bacterium]|nr:hypothetical protein [Bdellovibrionales bacterium]
MTIRLILFGLIVFPILSAYGVEVKSSRPDPINLLDRDDFKLGSDKIVRVQSGDYNISQRVKRALPANTHSSFSHLDQIQVAQSKDKNNPYLLAVRSTSQNSHDFIIMEGGAKVTGTRGGALNSDLVVTEIKNGKLFGRTRCQMRYESTQAKAPHASKDPTLRIVENIFRDVTQTPRPMVPKDKRHLMNCVTVNPQICEQLQGMDVSKMKSCMQMIGNLANNTMWSNLKAQEKRYADSWMFPFANNFFGNRKNENLKGNFDQSRSEDMRAWASRTRMTEKDTASLLSIAQNCELFNRANRPTASQSALPVPRPTHERTVQGSSKKNGQ